MAADVFTMLDDDVHPVEIVKRLRVSQDVVVALHEKWGRMRGRGDAPRGRLVLEERHLEVLATNGLRVTTPDELVGAVCSLRSHLVEMRKRSDDARSSR